MDHSLLFLQLVVILGVAKLLGLLLRHLGQPPVIGEMMAGIALGPIVFGALAPEWHGALFAPASLSALSGLSQLGLVLFMFIVGAELRMPDGARQQLATAGRVAVLGVVLPMLLGVAIAPMLHPQLAPAGVGFWLFALFMAVAMAITAFPVLARILKESGTTRTRIGRMALTAAAFADVLAWILLALVVAMIASTSGWHGFYRITIGLTVLGVVMFGVVKPLLAYFLARFAADGQPAGTVLTILLLGTFGTACVAEWLQLHAVFGAFLFGACLPRDDRLLASLIERVEHIALLVLMPIFFALAGLNTTADAFAGVGGLALLLILVVAIVGKIIGAGAGARWSGMSWRESLAVGTLMNTRGLMELIVMKVGLDAGVIGPEIFTMLMVMAIVTTLMTTPLLHLIAGRILDTSSPAGHDVPPSRQ